MFSTLPERVGTPCLPPFSSYTMWVQPTIDDTKNLNHTYTIKHSFRHKGRGCNLQYTAGGRDTTCTQQSWTAGKHTRKFQYRLLVTNMKTWYVKTRIWMLKINRNRWREFFYGGIVHQHCVNVHLIALKVSNGIRQTAPRKSKTIFVTQHMFVRNCQSCGGTL